MIDVMLCLLKGMQIAMRTGKADSASLCFSSSAAAHLATSSTQFVEANCRGSKSMLTACNVQVRGGKGMDLALR